MIYLVDSTSDGLVSDDVLAQLDSYQVQLDRAWAETGVLPVRPLQSTVTSVRAPYRPTIGEPTALPPVFPQPEPSLAQPSFRQEASDLACGFATGALVGASISILFFILFIL